MTGTSGASGGRDLNEIDALVTDRYLDSIFAAHARGADAGPMATGDVPSRDLRFAALRLARDLPRLHPSFRFEEALSARLTEAAARMRLPLAAGGEAAGGGGLVHLPSLTGLLPEHEPVDGPQRVAIGRELLIGGALTSAALSIAGAAWVAWRIRRAPSSPMARAVRAVARTRLA